MKAGSNRFQVNFRNHRKIVVVDGKEAWVGGHNVGNEYLGKGQIGNEFETCTLLFMKAIQSAKTRLWIASPYFVPDEQFITALHLAVLRGVDVRILIPRKTDSTLVSVCP